ncbi:hypothetical protein CO046_03260 [Candidatus Peregrinibacteria bacterium CG_4_9_14_0_2_um_filter_53_11]|nr:MAG: hypothetical protein CO046_03260 [Candidatus Peregrinibacteria bacterium CG_4_9_14_0_2_um_filter_53_11]
MRPPEATSHSDGETPTAGLDPVVAHDQTLAWYRAHAAEYVSKIAGLQPAEIRAFDKGLPEGGTVLDLGCAGGRDTAFFAQRHRAVGADPVPEFIEEARRAHPHVSFVVANGRALPFAEASFDAVCLRSVLLHMPDEMVSEVLAEVRRVARPGARGFIRVKKRLGGEKYLRSGGERRVNSNRLFNFFTKEEIIALVTEAGMTVEEPTESPSDDNSEEICLNCIIRFEPSRPDNN